MNRLQYKITNGCEANCKNCIHSTGGYVHGQYVYCEHCDEAFDPDCNDVCDMYEDDEPFDGDEEE